jgi:hypothetical protein
MKTIQEFETEITIENVVLKIVTRVNEYPDGHKEVVFSQYTQKQRNPRKGYDYNGNLAFVVK